MSQPVRRLVSTPMLHTPGTLRWLRAFRSTDLATEARDRAARFYMVSLMFPDLTGREVAAIVEGRYTVEGEDVLLDAAY